MAKLYRDDTSENSINQLNSGVSLLNFQWASFAGGASALGVIVLICGAIVICCLWRAKAGRRRRKNQERLLKAISTISSPANEPSASASAPPKASVSTTAPAPIAGSDWIRTPTGWTSIPSSYGAGSGGVPRLPYPQFPSLLYNGTRNSRHYYTMGISTDVATLHAVRPSRCEPSRQSHTTLAPPTVPCPDSPSCLTRTTETGDLSLPGPPVAALQVGESPLLDKDLLPLGRPALPRHQPRASKEDETTRLGCSPLPISAPSRILPKESIKTFNDCKSSAPGNVHSMKVRF